MLRSDGGKRRGRGVAGGLVCLVAELFDFAAFTTFRPVNLSFLGIGPIVPFLSSFKVKSLIWFPSESCRYPLLSLDDFLLGEHRATIDVDEGGRTTKEVRHENSDSRSLHVGAFGFERDGAKCR